MLVLKERVKKLFSLDGFIHIVFALLVVSIPMQYRFHKAVKPLAKISLKEGLELPAFFERIVCYCVSDVFILTLVVLFLCKKAVSFRSFFTEQSSKYLSIYFLISLTSLVLSKHSNFVLQYIRFFELMCSGLIFYIISRGLITKDMPYLIRRFMQLTLITALFQCGVAITQYFTQHALGLKKLGEINFSSPDYQASGFSMPNGSLWIFDHLLSSSNMGKGIVRAYGTLPDPNILGGFLVFSLLATFFLFVAASKKGKIALSVAIFLQFFSLFITFSRSAFIGIALGSFVFFSLDFIKNSLERKTSGLSKALKSSFSSKSLIIVLFGVFSISLLLFYPQLLNRGGYLNYKNTSAQGADNERIIYQKIAANIIKEHPLTGVGFNNYVLEMKKYSEQDLPYFFSHPVHNIFLLIASETGLLGLASFCMFIIATIWGMLRKGLSSETVLLTSLIVTFLFIGCCSHYFLTWNPGRLMFFTVFGLAGLVGLKKEERLTFPIKENYSEVTI